MRACRVSTSAVTVMTISAIYRLRIVRSHQDTRDRERSLLIVYKIWYIYIYVYGSRALSATSPSESVLTAALRRRARAYIHGVWCQQSPAPSILSDDSDCCNKYAAMKNIVPFIVLLWLMMIFVRDRKAACRRREKFRKPFLVPNLSDRTGICRRE